MKPIEIYDQWRSTLKGPDDSVFYYHPSLDRVILGCVMYHTATRPLVAKLGKAHSFSIINIYINDVVTAWIDGDGEAFEYVFHTLMTLMEAFSITSQAMKQRYPSKKKILDEFDYSYMYWCGVAGDISEAQADELLADIETDGKRIFSDKISKLVERIQPIVAREGMDMGNETDKK